MGNMLDDGSAWLAGKLKDHAGTTVTYIRGTASTVLTATIGKTELELLGDVGIDIQSRSIDFLVRATDLDLGSGPTEPQRGDTIVLRRGHEEITHEVVPLEAGQQCFRWSDPHGNILRIHTQRIDVV